MARYRIDPQRSPVSVDAESSMHPVRATSQSLQGTVDLDLDGAGAPDLAAPYGARMSIPITSIRSGHGLQDREMQRRLDTRHHPDITVDLVDASKLDGDGRYRARARITLHGRPQEVEGDVTVTVDGDSLVVEGEKTLDMRTFGVEPPRLLILKVSPEVVVRVRITAVREP